MDIVKTLLVMDVHKWNGYIQMIEMDTYKGLKWIHINDCECIYMDE